MITKDLLLRKEYQFVQEDPRLGQNVILLALSGSYSYGTNNKNSDIDLRGCTLETKKALIGFTNFEQVVDTNTDTTIYGFNKLVSLLCSCNPSAIEMLGCKNEHYLIKTSIGQELLDKKRLFLSQRAYDSFGGYANQQLRRLQNAIARDALSQPQKEQHILNSVKFAMKDFQQRYADFDQGSITLYIDSSDKSEFEEEIFMDTALRHYPLRDYNGLLSEINSIVKNYGRLSKRNRKKDAAHLNKHAMHLVRLYLMAIDLLEMEQIITYREKNLDLLMSIRRGEFCSSDGAYKKEFWQLVSELDHRLEVAKRKTHLPPEPPIAEIERFVMSVNERIINDKIT